MVIIRMYPVYNVSFDKEDTMYNVSRVPVYNVSCRVCGLHEKLLPEINLLAEAVNIQVKKFTK